MKEILKPGFCGIKSIELKSSSLLSNLETTAFWLRNGRIRKARMTRGLDCKVSPELMTQLDGAIYLFIYLFFPYDA